MITMKNMRTTMRRKYPMRIDIKKAAAVIAAGFMTLCSIPFRAAADNLQGAGDDPLTDGSFSVIFGLSFTVWSL